MAKKRRGTGDQQLASAEEHAVKSESLFEAKQYADAALEAEKALQCLPLMARSSLTRGRALLYPALSKMVQEGGLPPAGLLEEAGRHFTLAVRLDPECEEAKGEVDSLQKLLSDLPQDPAPASAAGKEPSGAAAAVDVIIVGAGAAGVGCALMLTKTFGLDASRVLLIERGEGVGDTFRRWPAEMRFISPSFNNQGWTNSFDLNSVAHGSSPAYSLHAQHPSGGQYADYLDALASSAKLNVRTLTEAGARGRDAYGEAREFQYPREGGGAIAGAELCRHNSRGPFNLEQTLGCTLLSRSLAVIALVSRFASLPGDDFVVIGGYESGADAAATVLASTATWDAPYTAERLRAVTAPGFSPRPKLLAPLRVLRVERAAGGGFDVVASWKAAESMPPPGPLRKPLGADATDRGAEGSEVVVHTAQPPLLCTGFEGSVASMARNLFAFADAADEAKAKGCLAGAPLLTEDDESTKVAGVFLVGPAVRHGEHSFCFVYKFRQRFGIVANAICRGLGRRDTQMAVEVARKMNMYLDDLKCCEATCGEAC
ncbi:hypothetical protein EMIHUDRAFT_215493 [Emiliania huxleyi CCMP1516]|uniref:Uncharacterized protein n=2 Tax=Emiliania huxleyi TaxID=2903 RepID=A0A0D3IHG5_EMIH1|nr:hypothetical protein EMIHUDRAFT_215493 [Emiliania huxleyi CCMP1516]EOD10700.1 hypothetical protein EMIHUDRAFT_215493 [Emiliania huxleyi CCMP1516]|eukprot:XP_005763129.1 hypothetical protein EMIHUDRAFT_215493 [Emiliania huxleyi CCMP1516]